MPRKNTKSSIPRTVALGYIRLSVTKNKSDLTSPARQKAPILKACQQYGWTPEIYEDADKHKSGSQENNRPEWMALKARLTDPDVAALVVDDQSRAMRNAWRAIKLFEELPDYGVKLHLAALDRTIDISTPDGRLSVYIQAFMDDIYVLEASRKAKGSVAYRKGKGVSIGIPPFGTVRDEKGFLIPSPKGAWLLPDGSFAPGLDRNEPPTPNAIWRGYADCAELILRIYARNQHGYQYIADKLNEDGWVFKDRWDQPRKIKVDDVRRVTANWREYAGLVQHDTVRAKERVANTIENPASILFETGRSVFDLDLLRVVATTQEKRSVTTRPSGSTWTAHTFALTFILYCARCEEVYESTGKITLRSRITGWNMRGNLRYRHSDSNKCGCKTLSVPIEAIEQDFGRLINAIQVKPEALELMAELALQSKFGAYNKSDEQKFEEEKRVAIAKHRLAIKNLLDLTKNGDIQSDEYFRLKEDNERQIAQWEARTTDRQEILLNSVIHGLR